FAQKIVRLETTVGRVLPQLRFAAALRPNPAVIGAFVFAFDARAQLFRLRVADAVTFFETIGQREQQGDDGLLVFGIDRENVVANAFRFARLVKQTIALRFF